jgi:hypothetical protein
MAPLTAPAITQGPESPAIRRRFAAEPIQHNGRVGRNLLDSERTYQAAARIRASFGSFAA